MAACWDEPVAPSLDEEDGLRLPPGIHAYITVSDRAAPVGETIVVTVNLQVVDVPVTVAGFNLTLAYNAAKLEPVEAQPASYDGMQVVNLKAPEGIRVAGAAARGIEGPIAVLIAATLKVKAPDYAEDLDLQLTDVTALEDFEQVAPEIAMLGRTVLTSRYLAGN